MYIYYIYIYIKVKDIYIYQSFTALDTYKIHI